MEYEGRNMNQITQTGGARVGWLSASWPMAKLSVSEEALTLKVSILGTFEFRRGQIIRLTKCGFIAG